MIQRADCLDFLAGLPAGSVDLVFGSPPYEVARSYGIDFNLRGQEWVDWMVKVFQASLRACKGLVAFVVEGQTRNFRWSATPAILMADLHRAGVHLRKPPAYCRVGIPGSGGPDWLRNDYEWIICATNGGKLPWSDNTAMGHTPKWAPGGEMSYRNSDGTRRNQWGGSAEGKTDSETGARDRNGKREKRGRPSHKIHTKRDGNRNGADELREQSYEPPKLANPGNALKAMYTVEEVRGILAACGVTDATAPEQVKGIVGGGLMGSDLAHENEAPFPEWLTEFFIRSFCPPDGIVLDPFAGSGTTLAVALRCGRRAIGCDIRQSQVDLTNRRLATVQKEMFI